ncbi:MAG TPA: hypothetical protein PKY08_00635 [Candidatus Magasanikbacteria bacterium]|nr:hypothetical protein [Candidatus Magasanikbacteria bacterium]
MRKIPVENLNSAVASLGYTHLFASALIRFRRGEKMFAIVADEAGPKAVVFDAQVTQNGQRVILSNQKISTEEKIQKFFRDAAKRKAENRWLDLSEGDLRRLASQEFPGSFFYDIFLNEEKHLFEVLPNISSLERS